MVTRYESKFLADVESLLYQNPLTAGEISSKTRVGPRKASEMMDVGVRNKRFEEIVSGNGWRPRRVFYLPGEIELAKRKVRMIEDGYRVRSANYARQRREKYRGSKPL